MNVPAVSLRCRTVVVTLVVLTMIWGVASFLTMPRREDPEYTVRTCVVMTAWPGAPADKVEQLVSDKIEQQALSIDGVKEVRSTSAVGLSTVYVDADDSIPRDRIDNIWDKVRARVALAELPDPSLTPIVNDEFGDTYIMLLAVYQQEAKGVETAARRYTFRELDQFSEQIADALKLLPGVSKADQSGVRDEAIYVETTLAQWQHLELTTTDLEQLVQARNIVAPGGSLETAAGRYTVTPSGDLNAVEELEGVVAGLRRDANSASGSGLPVYLRDLGLAVRRDYESPPKKICRYADPGHAGPCVMVAVSMKRGANITDICDAVKRRVRELQEVERLLPPDLGVSYVSDQSLNVNAKISGVVVNTIEAVLIVVVVVWLMVGFRSAAVMAANIPVVVLASLGIVTLFGVQLEQISLASIIIALGLLVDNAVQVCDQSRTNQLAGTPPDEATISGVNQVSLAMLGGTATTIAAFLPMLFGLSGSRAEYIYSLPVTVSTTLLVSWLFAMSFCAILAAKFIRAPRDPNAPAAPIPRLCAFLQRLATGGRDVPAGPNAVERACGAALRAAVRFKFVTVGLAAAMLVGAVLLPVGSEFFPRDLRDQFAVDVWLPDHVTIAETEAAAQDVERILQRLSPTTDAEGRPAERVLAIHSMSGGGTARWYLGRNPESEKPNYAELVVRTTDPRHTPWLAQRLREVCESGDAALGLKPVAGVRVIPRELALGPPVDSPIGFRILGSSQADERELRRVAEELKGLLRREPGTWDVHDNWGTTTRQARIEVDPDKANLAGVTNAGVAQSLNAFYSGHRLTTFREGDHLAPVYLRLGEAERGSLAALARTSVEGRFGKVPLDAVARIELVDQPARIERKQGNRVLEVRARVEEGYLANNVVSRLLAQPELAALRARLPAGYWIEQAGELEESKEGSAEMGVCLAISVLLIVLCLVLQYNGLAKPAIILISLPLTLAGALPGLYFTGYPLGFMAQLGILSLFGIVLNSAIIFFEFADVVLREAAAGCSGQGPYCGLTRSEFRAALARAAEARLMPIFLTTSTTIGGLIPLALAGGPLWEGMAWCMIFGLVVGTVLTLAVVPALFAIFVENFGVPAIRQAAAAEGKA